MANCLTHHQILSISLLLFPLGSSVLTPEHRSIHRSHQIRLSATLAGVFPRHQNATAHDETTRQEAITTLISVSGGDPLPAPVAGAVPPSPARDKRPFFCAGTDPGSDRASTGRKGHKLIQKNCAKLCAIVQTKKRHERRFYFVFILKQWAAVQEILLHLAVVQRTAQNHHMCLHQKAKQLQFDRLESHVENVVSSKEWNQR